MRRLPRTIATLGVCLLIYAAFGLLDGGSLGIVQVASAEVGMGGGKGKGGANGIGGGIGGGRGNDNADGRGRGNGPGSNNGVGKGVGGGRDGAPGLGRDAAPGLGRAATPGEEPPHAVLAPTASERGGAEVGELLALNWSQPALARARDAGFVPGPTERFAALDANLTVLHVPGNARQAMQALARENPGALLDLNTRYHLAGAPCADNRCYGQRLIGWQGSAAAGVCGRAVQVGMIDTGVDIADGALSGGRLRSRSLIGQRPPAPRDHGTAVAALLIGARSPEFSGLVPRAELFAADAFYRDGDGEVTTNAQYLLAALDWLLQEGVELINLSLTGPPNRLLQQAFATVHARGVLVVAAAGNAGARAPPAYPAAYPGVVAVTALDRFFRPYTRANRGDYVEFAAPGVDIWVPTGGETGGYHSGTSFASVFASAVAVDVISRAPPRTGDVVARLRDLTRDLGASGRDPVFGWGLLQRDTGCAHYAAAH